MKRSLKVAATILVVLLVAAALLIAFALRSVGTPEFKDALLRQARDRLGLDVEAKTLEVSIFEGLRLEGVRVKNPPGFAGELMSADAFVLRYRLWPLFLGRVELSRLELRTPSLRIVSDARGRYNYEGVTAPPGSRSGKGPRPAGSPAASSFVREIVISRLAMKDGDPHSR